MSYRHPVQEGDEWQHAEQQLRGRLSALGRWPRCRELELCLKSDGWSPGDDLASLLSLPLRDNAFSVRDRFRGLRVELPSRARWLQPRFFSTIQDFFPQLVSLEVVGSYGCAELNGAAASAMESLAQLPQLQELTLPSYSGMQHIAPLAPRLRKLRILTRDPESAAGPHAPRLFASLSRLQELHLSCGAYAPKVQNLHAQAVVAHLPPALERLTLSFPALPPCEFDFEPRAPGAGMRLRSLRFAGREMAPGRLLDVIDVLLGPPGGAPEESVAQAAVAVAGRHDKHMLGRVSHGLEPEPPAPEPAMSRAAWLSMPPAPKLLHVGCLRVQELALHCGHKPLSGERLARLQTFLSVCGCVDVGTLTAFPGASPEALQQLRALLGPPRRLVLFGSGLVSQMEASLYGHCGEPAAAAEPVADQDAATDPDAGASATRSAVDRMIVDAIARLELPVHPETGAAEAAEAAPVVGKDPSSQHPVLLLCGPEAQRMAAAMTAVAAAAAAAVAAVAAEVQPSEAAKAGNAIEEAANKELEDWVAEQLRGCSAPPLRWRALAAPVGAVAVAFKSAAGAREALAACRARQAAAGGGVSGDARQAGDGEADGSGAGNAEGLLVPSGGPPAGTGGGEAPAVRVLRSFPDDQCGSAVLTMALKEAAEAHWRTGACGPRERFAHLLALWEWLGGLRPTMWKLATNPVMCCKW